jgi:hypothetical protein
MENSNIIGHKRSSSFFSIVCLKHFSLSKIFTCGELHFEVHAEIHIGLHIKCPLFLSSF